MVEGKIDIHKSDKRLVSTLESIKKSKLINRELILEFDKHLRLEGCGYRHRLKTLTALKVMDGWIGKPFDQVASDDMIKLISKMREDKVGRSKNCPIKKSEPLSEITKANYLKAFKQCFRWMWIKKIYKGEETPETISYFRYKKNPSKRHEPLVLSLSQWQLVNERLSRQKYRCAVMVFFDTGARPEEFANIRKKDVTWDEKSKKYWINIRYEKINSHPRLVDVPYCTELLKRYMETKKNLKSDDPLFDISMTKFGRVLQFHCMKLFGAKATIYTLRHSSIQHYYDIYNGNLAHLANRYGWSYATAAKELQQYANRSKISLPDGSELAHQDKISDLANDNMKMQAKVDDVVRQLKEQERFVSISLQFMLASITKKNVGKKNQKALTEEDLRIEAEDILKNFAYDKKESIAIKEGLLRLAEKGK